MCALGQEVRLTFRGAEVYNLFLGLLPHLLNVTSLQDGRIIPKLKRPVRIDSFWEALGASEDRSPI